MLKIYQFSKDTITPANWAGGKTFEYFIYPEKSQYNQRDFLARISSASIEDIPSVFTKFHHYTRYLVMLNNELKLTINQRDEIYSKGEVFKFQSDDEVLSYSLGNDFNLMLSDTITNHSVEVIDGTVEIKYDYAFVFALQEVDVSIENKEYCLRVNDLLVIESKGIDPLIFFLKEKAIVGGWDIPKVQ